MPTEKGKSPKAAKEPAIALPETTPEQIEALAKNILVSEFSIEEDILFLRAQQGHGLTIRELPKKYADKKKQQPKSFLHECKAEVFRERLLQMPEDKPRARLLEMELQRQLAMEAEAKADVVEVSAAVVPPLLLQLSSVSHPPIRGHKRNIEQVRCRRAIFLHFEAFTMCRGARRWHRWCSGAWSVPRTVRFVLQHAVSPYSASV
jgi:hypothetical protein